MKFLKIIKKIIVTLIAIAFFAFAIAMTILLLYFNDYGVTQFEDKSLIIIRGNITSEKYKKGDIVVVESQDINEIQKGDEIFAYNLKEDKSVELNLGKVDQIDKSTKAISFENGEAYSMSFVAGKAIKVYNKVGTYLAIIESTWGFLFIILVPSFLIFVYQVYALIVEIKYGSED